MQPFIKYDVFPSIRCIHDELPLKSATEIEPG
jgi:hypothetical protein